jgi:hypothetical protein
MALFLASNTTYSFRWNKIRLSLIFNLKSSKNQFNKSSNCACPAPKKTLVCSDGRRNSLGDFIRNPDLY